MKIIIVGDGKVGLTLTELLASEGHEIIVVDQNIDVLRHAQELYDVLCVSGKHGSVKRRRRGRGRPGHRRDVVG